MSGESSAHWRQWARGLLRRPYVLIVGGVVVVAAAAAATGATMHRSPGTKNVAGSDTEVSSQAKRPARFVPTAAQWASLGMVPAKPMTFRPEHMTEGKISINEDRTTAIFPPYAGRVTRVLVKPGDVVHTGQPLFYIEATDMVQAQNDFLAAVGTLNKARSAVSIAETIEKQNRSLYEGKAGPLRDYQTAQATLVQARADLQNAEAGVQATRNRLSILGKTDAEIDAFQSAGKISSETPIYAPLDGIVVQRKLGPGQYVSYVSTGIIDPVLTIGDLSSVWVVAYVREGDAPKMRAGEQIDFSVLAYPNTTFKASLDHVAASLDPTIRRLLVRATIDNSKGMFKPEMFTSVTIYTDDADNSVGVPREAVLYEADNARVWVARPDRTIELRPVKVGMASGDQIQILQGVQSGEMVVTKGSLFVDQAAGS